MSFLSLSPNDSIEIVKNTGGSSVSPSDSIQIVNSHRRQVSNSVQQYLKCHFQTGDSI